jgi:murein DD-endopeptidase MepM/ murein hydrolase activator NlpD
MQAREQINQLQEGVKTLAALDKAIVYLPIAQPIPTYYVTSAFGPRIDPFTREWAFHTGIDVAGKVDEVQTTLPGRVSFAGSAYGYGKMVEVDHGFGIKTRYGHLKKFIVRKGSKVRFKQIIGLMGDTGRSTGKHLHYEILFNDKPYDPWKFIEAGKNVFEASQ